MTLDEPKNLFSDSDKDTDRLIGRVLAGNVHIHILFRFHIKTTNIFNHIHALYAFDIQYN